jgi:hypothetical protein
MVGANAIIIDAVVFLLGVALLGSILVWFAKRIFFDDDSK